MGQGSPPQIWTFSPVYPDLFSESKPKVFMIGAEPAGGRRHPPNKDMGDWFRLARENDCWDDPNFYQATLLCLRTVLGLPVDGLRDAERDLTILRHMRYIDLKATEGRGPIPDPPMQIQEYVRNNIVRIIGYWKSDTPEITVLLGWAAQRLFERMLKSELVKAGLAEIRRVGLSHPSQFSHDLGFTDAISRLRTLSERLHYWGPIAKRWKVGIP